MKMTDRHLPRRFGDLPASGLSSPESVPLVVVGSPLVDLLVEVGPRFLQRFTPGTRGETAELPRRAFERLLAQCGPGVRVCPGGSAANIAVGCGQLGIRTTLVGTCGADPWGERLRLHLRDRGCLPLLRVDRRHPTGRVLVLVTADGERTMRINLGASRHLHPAQLPARSLRPGVWVVIEGYLAHAGPLLHRLVERAKAAGCRVALDLGSPEVVRRCAPVLQGIKRQGIDLLFANRDEGRAWKAIAGRDVLADWGQTGAVVCLKLGARGALVAAGTRRIRLGTAPGAVTDTVGAGDAWAAGFLAGTVRGLALATCADLAARAAAAAVQVPGAEVPPELWRRLKIRLTRRAGQRAGGLWRSAVARPRTIAAHRP